MPSKKLCACLDANVLISGIAFGGKPLEILQALVKRHFVHVTCAAILEETRRNLLNKIGLSPDEIQDVFRTVSIVSTIVEPQGSLRISKHLPDNLILESALLGGCDVIVTGDKRHLLSLKSFNGIPIESPAEFLKRLPPVS